MRNFVSSVAAASFFLASQASGGVIYTFGNITNNSAPDAAAGEAQLAMEVSGVGSEATFRFSNTGPEMLVITDVYFDDGTLLALATITNGPGVDFGQGANPGNLPGGGTLNPPFNATVGFSADSNPPPIENGVAPGEWVEFLFELQSGQGLADVIASLGDGSLRVGLHVQGFVGGGSESYVNVPAPGAGLLGAAACIFGARRRRR